MTRHIKNILKGVGSVIDIAPSTDYQKFVSKQSPGERMYGHWHQAGQHIHKATDQFSDGQKIKK